MDTLGDGLGGDALVYAIHVEAERKGNVQRLSESQISLPEKARKEEMDSENKIIFMKIRILVGKNSKHSSSLP